jgi:hypothetical protein
MKDGSDSSDSEDEGTNFDSSLNLCLPALHYLRQCCNIIATMHRMPNCPVFDGAHRYAQFCSALEKIVYFCVHCCFTVSNRSFYLGKATAVRPDCHFNYKLVEILY